MTLNDLMAVTEHYAHRLNALGIGVDLSGLLGGTNGECRRWVRVEWGGIWEGCPLSSRLRGLGERRELPQRGPGRSDFGVF